MDDVPFEKVQQIVNLFSSVASRSGSVAERREALAAGIAQLIDADIWVWIHSRIGPESKFPTGFAALDGGWTSDAERSAFLTGLHDAELNEVTGRAFALAGHQTLLMQEIFRADDPASGVIRQRWSATSGMGECIVSVYPLDERTMSGLGFHRRLGKPEFTGKEKAVVHLILAAVGWLHADGTEVPGNDNRLLELSPREREVLLYLLQGDPRKRIAARLKLSHYTIADHTKSIYKTFGVNSRAELHALFMRKGGLPAAE